MKISLILLLSLATVLHPAQAKPIDQPRPIWALKFDHDVLPLGWGWGSPGWRPKRTQELARRRNILKTLAEKAFKDHVVEVQFKKAIKDHVVEVQFKILFSIFGICAIIAIIAIIVCLILVYKQKRKSTDSQTIDV